MNKAMRLEERWQKNLPVNVKDLAEIQHVSYSTAARWAQSEDFPRVGDLLKREDFEDWWKRRARRSWKSEGWKSGKDTRRPPLEPAQSAPDEISGSPEQNRIAKLNRQRELIEEEILVRKEREDRSHAQVLLCDDGLLRGLPPKAAALLREARS
ncbi:MAG TPA: hypothetical protein VIS96_12135 [Terrimicrobiaceae bacterium]